MLHIQMMADFNYKNPESVIPPQITRVIEPTISDFLDFNIASRNQEVDHTGMQMQNTGNLTLNSKQR